MSIVITKNDIIKLIEMCFSYRAKDVCRVLDCLEAVAKLLAIAVENKRKELVCEKDKESDTI